MTLPVAYTVFHINMAFSSIEEEDRATVIERCYWPLLKLAEDGYPIGIEGTGYSLRAIKAIDPNWIEALKRLIEAGIVEFIGSGYTQMIAPLVPADMTRKNLELGNDDYLELLGVQPQIALINEQAYSPGLLPLYKNAGYQAVMMDWSESASHTKKWQKQWSWRPQMLAGEAGIAMPVVWSDAISFQKLQRYAHNDIDASEYLEFLNLQLEAGTVAFPLYSSDAEVFDYRPGRFGSEAKLVEMSEYQRIQILLQVIQRSDAVKLGTPSDALKTLKPNSKPISLETTAVPVPVKKQRKYNLLRWAVSGRDDLYLNTACWRIYSDLFSNDSSTEEDWRGLCRWWASDLRTHITDKRWAKLVGEITAYNEQTGSCGAAARQSPPKAIAHPDVSVREEGRYIIVEGSNFHVCLNTRRGMAVQSMGYGAYRPAIAGGPLENGLIGTLAHGFYGTIEFGADFYTGHYVSEPASRHKVTDLVPCSPEIDQRDGHVILTAELTIGPQVIVKTLDIDVTKNCVEVSYCPPFNLPMDGSARFGHLNLNPRAFDPETLYFDCQNGGDKSERYGLWDQGLEFVDHGVPVSRLVSATTGLGLTDGILELGDKDHFVRLVCDRADVAACGMITAKEVGDSFFMRAALTLAESDETRQDSAMSGLTSLIPLNLRYKIEIGRHGA